MKKGKETEPAARAIDLKKIRIDGGTQPRASMDEGYIAELVEAIDAGEELPPGDVFYDGMSYWLADGFHRHGAYRKAGKSTMLCRIHQGGQREAILFSVGANASHGLRRSNADKRRAIERMLRDPEWGKWTNTRIAVQCGVNDKTVGAAREAIFGNSEDAPSSSLGKSQNRTSEPPATRVAHRGGKSYQIDTSNIGRSHAPSGNGAATHEHKPEPSKPPAADDSGFDLDDLDISDQADKAPVPALTKPAVPWAEFDTALDDAITTIKSGIQKLRKAMDLNEQRQVRCKWAQYMTYLGAIDPIKNALSHIKSNRPARISNKPPGFIPQHKAELDDAVANGRK